MLIFGKNLINLTYCPQHKMCKLPLALCGWFVEYTSFKYAVLCYSSVGFRILIGQEDVESVRDDDLRGVPLYRIRT